MPRSGTKESLSDVRAALAHRIDFAEFLGKLHPKDRVSAEKRISAFEAESAPGRAELWRRLACSLMTLSPHAAKFVGRQTVQFYVADGKYRKQVFALEDLQDGNMTVYCPDVLAEATEAGLLAPTTRVETRPDGGEATFYMIEPAKEPLHIDSLDSSSLNPGAHFKDLTGWNRKALRITLPPSPSPAQVEATELICAIAARHFPAPPAGGASAPS